MVEHLQAISHHASLSDHCGVKLSLKLDYSRSFLAKNPRGYWKLDSSIIQEDSFLESFTVFWRSICKQQKYYNDLADWWDLFAKPEMKTFCIGYSIKRKQRRMGTKCFLLAYLKKVLEANDWAEISRVKSDLKQMLNEDMIGFVVRSRFQQTDNATIENTVVEFFSALFNGHHDTSLNDTGCPFTPNNTFLHEFLDNLPCLGHQDAEKFQEEVTIEELGEVLKDCATIKSPGLDGFPYEFYRTTWSVIGSTFTKIIKNQLDRGSIIVSNTVGATRLCPKVQGIPKVDQLRPITLLNCDYKILSKLLVKRLKPVLPSIIRSSQLCTVQGKNILFGVNNIISSILYVNQKRLRACLINLDFLRHMTVSFCPS